MWWPKLDKEIEETVKWRTTKVLTSWPNNQNFTLHCNAMKAIKSLNDQDVLVYNGTVYALVKWDADHMFYKENLSKILLGQLVRGNQWQVKTVY